MKKLILIGGFALVIAVSGCGQADHNEAIAPAESGKAAQSDEKGALKTACDFYTAEIAQAMLGSGAIFSQELADESAVYEGITVTNCGYYLEDNSGRISNNTTITTRSAKKAEEKENNISTYNDSKDRTGLMEGHGYDPTESIDNMKYPAFWDPTFKNVSVLVDDGTYLLNIGAKDRAVAEQLARLIIE